jgi:transcriptional regulator GlxA family with amidase domain
MPYFPEVTGWLERHLDQQVTVAELAALAHMSPRTFAAYRSTFRTQGRRAASRRPVRTG